MKTSGLKSSPQAEKTVRCSQYYPKHPELGDISASMLGMPIPQTSIGELAADLAINQVNSLVVS